MSHRTTINRRSVVGNRVCNYGGVPNGDSSLVTSLFSAGNGSICAAPYK